ncbi:anti-sigma factor family protein [Pseudonocardia sp.]|uniref:anti-sigma factor family protein n=1 Tax=Pseudonocardia sp. TaxID=60912 RepID=UPI003D0C2188
MTAPRRRFEVVAPDWGQTHLTSDAVVAFVDDELSTAAHGRALRHLESCPGCASDVAEQRQARSALRSARGPELSSALLNALRSIPRDTELPAPPAGLAVDPDGHFVQPLRPAREALPTDVSARTVRSGPQIPGPVRSGRASRRWGAGLTATGIALGALALTGAVMPADSPVRGVFGGPVLDSGSTATRLQAAPSPVVGQIRPAAVPFGRGGVARGGGAAAGQPGDPGTERVLRQLDALPGAHPTAR